MVRLGLRGSDRFAPQVAGKTDKLFRELRLVGSAKDQRTEMANSVVILDQLNTSSCVANAFEQAIRVALIHAGATGSWIELGSRAFGYFNSRMVTGDQTTDEGTYLRTYASAASKNGRCPERLWKFDPKKINVQPSLKTYMSAFGNRGLKAYHRIDEIDDSRMLAMKAAIDHKFPIVFGMRVDNAFLNSGGPSVVSIPTGEIVGGHAMCIVGYRHEFGKLQFLVANSWGKSWRSGGFVWMTSDALKSRYVQDIWVVEV